MNVGVQVRTGLLIWDISAFRLKTKTSAKYGLAAQPRLVDIIAAVPPQYRKALVPKLKAKPIRTASGVKRIRHSVHPPPSPCALIDKLYVVVLKDRDIERPEGLM